MEKYVVCELTEDGKIMKMFDNAEETYKYLREKKDFLRLCDIVGIKGNKKLSWWHGNNLFTVLKCEMGKCACCDEILPIEPRYIEVNTGGIRTYHEVMMCNECFLKEMNGSVQAYLTKDRRVKFKVIQN